MSLRVHKITSPENPEKCVFDGQFKENFESSCHKQPDSWEPGSCRNQQSERRTQKRPKMKSMNAINDNPVRSRSIEDLKNRHLIAVNDDTPWQEVWEIFYRNRWFRQTLLIAARRAVRRAGRKRDCVDDVRQEALVEFSRSLQRNVSLGFDPGRGNFAAFVGLIVHRCCLKALRQFRHQCLSLHDEGFFHPYYEEQSQIEKIFDLRKAASELQEPYRSLVRQVCNGDSIDEIADRSKRSRRTIYRWLDRSVELLKVHYFAE